METTQDKSPSSSKPSHNEDEVPKFARFSGLAFELLGILIAGVGGGYGLDILLDNQIPVLTIVFSLLSLIGMIAYLWRRLPRD